MSAQTSFKNTIIREILLFLVLLVVGFAVLPPVTFFVGELVFGAYGGDGLSDFYDELLGKLGRGDSFAWLLVLSPYIITQSMRLMALGWRHTGASQN